MSSSTLSRSLTLPLFTLLTACGSGALDADFNPPYATLKGSIVSSSVPTPSEVRVALVWVPIYPGGPALKSAQEVGVRTDFPVRFQLDIDRLPPPEAMNVVPAAEAAKYCVEPGVKFAYGTVVVYEDLDGDGQLGLIPVDATTAPDRVLGVPAGTTLIFIEGDATFLPGCALPPYLAGLTFHPGFNLVSEPIGPSFTGDVTSLPLSTEIEIALTADPLLTRYICQPGQAGIGGVNVCNQPGCAAPPGAKISCAPDRASYAWTLPSAIPSLCGSYRADYGVVALPASGEIPAGWPCLTEGIHCGQIVDCIQTCAPADLGTCVPACIAKGSPEAQDTFQPLSDCATVACYESSTAPCGIPTSPACMTCVENNCGSLMAACRAQ
jgi:hypothetical protein